MKTYHFDVIDSTSSYLKSNYNDYDDITFVSASFQTNGHGRYSREWISNKGENLLFSILIKDKDIINKFSSLSLASAVAVFKSLKNIGLTNIFIKWPNDVYVNDKKIAGILMESVSFSKTIEALVIGVGINVNAFNFKKELKKKATSIFLEIKEKVDIEKIKQNVYLEFEQMIKKIKNSEYPYLEIVKKNNYLANKDIYADINGKRVLVKFIDISDDNQIVIEYKKKYYSLHCGEIFLG